LSTPARKSLFLLGLLLNYRLALGHGAGDEARAKSTPKKAATVASRPRRKRRSRRPSAAPPALDGRWSEPSFTDATEGDQIDGEDLTVRRGRRRGPGRMNGTVVVVDPRTGRVLSIVTRNWR